MITFIAMRRKRLITLERRDYFCEGKSAYYKLSLNDDFESLLEDIQRGKQPKDEVSTYFFTKINWTRDEISCKIRPWLPEDV